MFTSLYTFEELNVYTILLCRPEILSLMKTSIHIRNKHLLVLHFHVQLRCCLSIGASISTTSLSSCGFQLRTHTITFWRLRDAKSLRNPDRLKSFGHELVKLKRIGPPEAQGFELVKFIRIGPAKAQGFSNHSLPFARGKIFHIRIIEPYGIFSVCVCVCVCHPLHSFIRLLEAGSCEQA